MWYHNHRFGSCYYGVGLIHTIAILHVVKYNLESYSQVSCIHIQSFAHLILFTYIALFNLQMS
jgi:hypothetical protein